MSSPITVYLADDHQIVLKGIRSVLRLDPGLKVVGTTTDSKQIISDIVLLKPRVLVLDMSMPDIPGIEIVRSIRKSRSIKTRVVIFTMHHSIGYVEHAFREGAYGFVVKEADTEHLIKAIKAATCGRHYLSPPFTTAMIDAYRRQLRSEEDKKDVLEELTRREREVLIFAAQGLTNLKIADKMGISVRTVERHRYQMRKKTGLKNNADIAQFAMRRGLIT